MSSWNEKIIEEFRANNGKVGGGFKDMQLLLLHTTGAKSGKTRVNPLATIREDERWIVIASKGGAPTHPDWYHNLKANPEVTVEVGVEKFDGVTEVVEEPERTKLYTKVETQYPGFKDYREKAGRVIPVIAIKPKS